MTVYPTFKTNAEEDFRKDYEIFNETITADNVKRMGELIALYALRFSAVRCGGYYSYLYRCLLKDIFNPHKEKEHIISDGYDYAQDAILFLWHFIGKKPSDICKIDRNGKEITIKSECIRYINRILARDKKRKNTQENIEEVTVGSTVNEIEDIDEHQKNVEKIIRKMKLKKAEKAVLKCYMMGMKFVQIARHLCIDNSIVWHRRQRLQIKYMAAIK